MASTVDTTAVALRGGDHTASLNFVGIAKELVADMGTSGDGTDAEDALSDMFFGTGGTFTGTPTINTTYYTDHQPV